MPLMKAAKSAIRRYAPESWVMGLSAIDHYYNGEPEIRILKHLLRRGELCIDIGANMGVYSFFFTRYGGDVIAYEPIPELADRLRRLFPKADIRQAGASDEAGEATLNIPCRDGRGLLGQATITGRLPTHDDLRTVAIRKVRLDDENIDHADLIKIDVEQHELHVLRGAAQLIARARPILIVEVSPLLYPPSLFDSFRTILDQDYFGVYRAEGRYRRHTAFDQARHCSREAPRAQLMNNNVLFIPNEKADRAAAFLDAA